MATVRVYFWLLVYAIQPLRQCRIIATRLWQLFKTTWKKKTISLSRFDWHLAIAAIPPTNHKMHLNIMRQRRRRHRRENDKTQLINRFEEKKLNQKISIL